MAATMNKLDLAFHLKDEPETVFISFLCKKDVSAVLDTGYGKTLIYQLAPLPYKDVSNSFNTLLSLAKTDNMLPAVVKLCCGISYPHLRSMSGLQRTAVAVISKEITQMKHWAQIKPHTGQHDEPKTEVMVSEDQLFYIQHGKEALRKAVSMLEDREGWKLEIQENHGDVICSKMIPGAGKVFRLEAVLEASLDDLYDLLFVRVEDMHQWNPSVQQIKVLKRAGSETVVTHEISAATTGNLIGQRDFLSVRHSCKQKSCLYLGGAAIRLESFPPQAGFVRAEDGPTCIIIKALDEDGSKSSFTWLLNMDVKGWLPKSIVNQGLPRAQLDFIRHLRKHLRHR